MDTVKALTRVADLVAADGWPVTYVNGWQSRGRGKPRPGGAVNHWTADGATGDHPSLHVVTHGRAGLENALCNTYSSREPRLYIVAARVAWHAGRGGWRGLTGNTRVLGHEAENSGGGEWTEQHLALIASLDRAQIAVFGYGVEMVCDHFEWTSRKIDRRDVGGPQWRERIRAQPIDQEDDMPSKEEVRDAILNADVGGKPVRNRIHDADVRSEQNRKDIQAIRAQLGDRDYDRETGIIRRSLRKLAAAAGVPVTYSDHIPDEVEA